ncbi:DUF3788 domain-containing protein [Clostridium boliviensis]|uniref:DUF3788 domain-containing protein n=1 Tax=Clostridium boliviensis TaxID=318465 RepID=A0ABU4GL49_9CLOT|nr:DUF3788 domain-containing protein [Clostridium boliviensis]MDW2798347.1 DUF3788 domain-containing protein [Clostridium boliviensis]
MLEKIPSREEMISLIGGDAFHAWEALCKRIEEVYDMDRLWNSGGKAWKYEYKYRRGGKTLCALYAGEGCSGFMVILGKAEREKFELDRQNYLPLIQEKYDTSTTFHDGKWIMLPVDDVSLFDEFINLLKIKRRPNRK